jgi:hypothetical protein
VSGAELQHVAVTRWREADLVVGEAGAPAAAPIEPSEADSLEASALRLLSARGNRGCADMLFPTVLECMLLALE